MQSSGSEKGSVEENIDHVEEKRDQVGELNLPKHKLESQQVQLQQSNAIVMEKKKDSLKLRKEMGGIVKDLNESSNQIKSQLKKGEEQIQNLSSQIQSLLSINAKLMACQAYFIEQKIMTRQQYQKWTSLQTVVNDNVSNILKTNRNAQNQLAVYTQTTMDRLRNISKIVGLDRGKNPYVFSGEWNSNKNELNKIVALFRSNSMDSTAKTDKFFGEQISGGKISPLEHYKKDIFLSMKQKLKEIEERVRVPKIQMEAQTIKSYKQYFSATTSIFKQLRSNIQNAKKENLSAEQRDHCQKMKQFMQRVDEDYNQLIVYS